MNLPLLLAHNTGSVFNGLDRLVIVQRVLAGENQLLPHGVMGIFWKRATVPAAFWAFLVGAVGGFFRLGLYATPTTAQPPKRRPLPAPAGTTGTSSIARSLWASSLSSITASGS
jgi:Na+/proline symporter